MRLSQALWVTTGFNLYGMKRVWKERENGPRKIHGTLSASNPNYLVIAVTAPTPYATR
jgi:hypothetical protein